MITVIKFAIELFVPDSKGLRRICMVGALAVIFIYTYMEINAVRRWYEAYCDPTNYYADSNADFISSEEGCYGSVIMSRLYGQKEWQPFIDMAAGDMVEIMAYAYNTNADEAQDVYATIRLAPSLRYVQGSVQYKLASSTEWRQFDTQSEIDELFEKYIDFGACPSGECISIRLVVEMDTEKILDDEDTFANIVCQTAPGRGISATRSVVGVCHRTANRLSNFFHAFTYQSISLYISLVCGIILDIYLFTYLHFCIKKERSERDEPR